MPQSHAFICYRVLARLEQQGRRAADEKRWDDNAKLFRLVGSLEFQIFGTCSFELSFEEAASKYDPDSAKFQPAGWEAGFACNH